MKKLICLLLMTAFALTACTAISNDLSANSEESSANIGSTDNSVCSGTASSDAESSDTPSSKDESSAAVSSEDAVDSEESSVAGIEVSRITAQISAISAADFTTNIADCEQLNALREYLEGSGYGYFYCDLEYNAYAAYGCDTLFKTASTAKLPYAKYLYALADSGKINLNESIIFEERHKTSGSGVMKSMATGGAFSVQTLLDYTLRYSDNIAYSMLIERFGLSGYFEYVASLGVNYTTAANGYTSCTAATMAALLFDVAHYNGANLSLMLNAGCNASYNYQIGAELSEYKVLQKYGAMKPGNIAYHDIAVVYAPHPYILVIYTTVDYDSATKNVPFRNIARLTDDLNRFLFS